jgi:hypothetical protein
MSRPRLGVPPKPKGQPRTIEYSILVGCVVIVAFLFWRMFGAALVQMTRPQRNQAVVVILSDDDCLGGLCSAPAARGATRR